MMNIKIGQLWQKMDHRSGGNHILEVIDIQDDLVITKVGKWNRYNKGDKVPIKKENLLKNYRCVRGAK